MEKDVRLIMIAAASSAFNSKKANPHAETSEVIKQALKCAKTHEEKMVAMASVSYVLKYLEKRPNAFEKEVMQNFLNETNQILHSLMNEESQ